MGKTYSLNDIFKEHNDRALPPSTMAIEVTDAIFALPTASARLVVIEAVERLLVTENRNVTRSGTERPIIDGAYASGEITPPPTWKPSKTRVRTPVLVAGQIPKKAEKPDRYERWTRLTPADGIETIKFGWVTQLEATLEQWECRRTEQLKRQQDFQPSIDYCTLAINDLKREGVNTMEELLQKRGL